MYTLIVLIILSCLIYRLEAAFISVWDTGDTNSISLPLSSTGTYNFEVDWGDGLNATITSYDEAAITHEYASNGQYTLSITGTIIGFDFTDADDEKPKLLEISQWGIYSFSVLAPSLIKKLNITYQNINNKYIYLIFCFEFIYFLGELNIGNGKDYFKGCTNLNVTATDDLNLTGTLSLYGMFQDCGAITGYSSISLACLS